MATERLSMRQIREILRQKRALGLSHRAMASSLRVGLGTISRVVSRAHAAGLDWPQVQALADEALEGRLYGRPEVAGQRQRPALDCAWVHAERRRPGVTLELLHLEYLERYPDGYRYTRFCDLYRAWLARRRLSMRQVHRAGDKCFVDYAGQTPRLIDPTTRRGRRGRALCRRPRSLELHLRRGDPHPAGARLDRQPHPRLGLLRRRHRGRRLRPAQKRRRPVRIPRHPERRFRSIVNTRSGGS